MSKQRKSKFARKEEWRRKNCGGAPLPCFPEIVAMPSHLKPWGAESKSAKGAA